MFLQSRISNAIDHNWDKPNQEVMIKAESLYEDIKHAVRESGLKWCLPTSVSYGSNGEIIIEWLQSLMHLIVEVHANEQFIIFRQGKGINASIKDCSFTTGEDALVFFRQFLDPSIA